MDDRTRQAVASDRVQRRFRMAKRRPDALDGKRLDSPDSPINSERQRLTSMVGTTGRVQSGQPARPVKGRKLGFIPNGYFLHGTYK